MRNHRCAVYILTNKERTVLYTGVTSDLQRRAQQHKSRRGSEFTRRDKLTQLVHYELGDDISRAILREKQIKGGSRQDKLDLIDRFNPEWKDLYEELFVQAAD